MRRLSELLSEDTNQFGPGTDLFISMLAVLLIMFQANSYYQHQKETTSRTETDRYEREVQELKEQLRKEREERLKQEIGFEKKFALANETFEAGDFMARPFRKLRNVDQAMLRVQRIVDQYRAKAAEYPYIFVIGHSSTKYDPAEGDQSEEGRLFRNWNYAGERAAIISSYLEKLLTPAEMDRIVVLSTGQFDRRVEPADSDDNAWVEVVFGKEWKPPSRDTVRTP